MGTGNGYSNRQILDMIQKVSGKKLQIEEKERRFGDPAVIYGDNTKAKQLLGFNPQYSDLQTIVESAYLWHKSEKNSK